MLRPTKANPTGTGEHPAPFASRPADTRGRRYPEPASPSRTDYQRDRDRIIHSAAFRRLQHKTQVFVYHVGDHYRTRLTHSIEVAQIARSAARALGLNEDLAEAVALAHDLGHPPFGHAGEDALNRSMAGTGGFDHNAHALRLVTQLEARYAGFDGLNLTWEALEGLVKHNGPLVGPNSAGKPLPESIAAYVVHHDLELASFAGPEAQIAALADDIAYINHDLDDGVRAGLFTLEQLAVAPLVGPILVKVRRLYPSIEPARVIHETVRRLIDGMVTDMVAETRRRAAATQPADAQAVRALAQPLVAFSPDWGPQVKALRSYLYRNMYQHPTVAGLAGQGARIVSDLFSLYQRDPAALPEEWRAARGGDAARGTESDPRRIADFIAGMTDRFAVAQHRKRFPNTPLPPEMS